MSSLESEFLYTQLKDELLVRNEKIICCAVDSYIFKNLIP